MHNITQYQKFTSMQTKLPVFKSCPCSKLHCCQKSHFMLQDLNI